MGPFRATPSGLSRPFWVPLGDKSTDRLMTQDEGDWTALHAAAKHGSEEMVQDVVVVMGDKSAELQMKNNNEGWSALHQTVEAGVK